MLGGRYELGAPLGSGGFGTVFRARDRRTGAELAIKWVLPGLGADAAAERLRHEGAVLRTVVSRRVAQVFDLGDDEHGVWLVTALVEGGPLATATLGRALLPHEVLRVARGLLEGLADVHAAGVVHGDVKPANVLVTHGSLDGVKLVDFGLARIASRADVAAAIGEAAREGTVLGTARWMAPEVLVGGIPSPRTDLYGAGLVLHDLLDIGHLFPGDDVRAELRARVAQELVLGELVPEPLSDVLGRLLAREPARRFRDAREAYDAVLDLDTAPVAVLRRESMPAVSPRSAPPSARPSLAPRPSVRPSSPPRLTTLPPDGLVALRETLRHLDLPMLDALARRERGNQLGRIARGVALALRLELDAAALILEPLALQSDVARAIGVTLLAPRARRVTRARVDPEREDLWIDTIDPELAAMLVALATALSTPEPFSPESATRDASRCARVRARLDGVVGAEAVQGTLAVAHAVARWRGGEIDRATALAAMNVSGEGLTPFHVVVRALSAASVAVDATDLSAAERIAAETGTTLLDAAAAAALGALYAATMPPDGRALEILDRAGTLLSHGDAPSLEHEAEHHRATVLVAHRRYAEAIAHFRGARDAARAERALDLDTHGSALQAICELALGEVAAATESASVLVDARLATASGPVAVAAWVARALVAHATGEDPARATAMAAARLGDARGAAESTVLAALAQVLFDADVERGTRAIECHPSAHFWLEVVLAAGLDTRGALESLAARVLQNASRTRQTDAPPPLQE